MARIPKTAGVVPPAAVTPEPRLKHRVGVPLSIADGIDPTRRSIPMMAGSNCGCLICRLESSLIAELSEDRSQQEFRVFTAHHQALAAFPTALALVEHLHRHQDREQNSSSDRILLELLGPSSAAPLGPMQHGLLLLAFIPTMHRTATQVTTAFPAIARDDAAQHLFTILLEFLPSKELQSRRSHLAFTIARKMRRSAFRWAIRESRTSLRNEMDGTATGVFETDVSVEDSRSKILLWQFLDDCQRRGWLSSEERELLTQFKLEGISGSELARRSGHSVVAIRHRIQRLLDRLRRIAREPRPREPEQLKLFSR
jgi:DNA-directed RNA polymerase specialized sigma24 family protein